MKWQKLEKRIERTSFGSTLIGLFIALSVVIFLSFVRFSFFRFSYLLTRPTCKMCMASRKISLLLRVVAIRYNQKQIPVDDYNMMRAAL
jgi:hypothetical protein